MGWSAAGTSKTYIDEAQPHESWAAISSELSLSNFSESGHASVTSRLAFLAFNTHVMISQSCLSCCLCKQHCLGCPISGSFVRLCVPLRLFC